jgi:hypothetical protein
MSESAGHDHSVTPERSAVLPLQRTPDRPGSRPRHLAELHGSIGNQAVGDLLSSAQPLESSFRAFIESRLPPKLPSRSMPRRSPSATTSS